MRSKTLIVLALALLAPATIALSHTPAANVNRRLKPKRPSAAIGAGGAGTYARRTRRKAPTAAPTPQAPNSNASFLGGQTEGTGVRRKPTRKRRRP